MRRRMSIKDIAQLCRGMKLGETRSFEIPEDHAAVEICRQLDTLQTDFTFDINDHGYLIVERTHLGPPEPL